MKKMTWQSSLIKFALSGALVLSPTTLMASQQGGGSAPTADQSKNDSTDRSLARKIRRDVEKDKNLSINGHNVKIIAISGKVTLRGPVRNDDEKKAILQYAQKYAGDGNVTDEMTVSENK